MRARLLSVLLPILLVLPLLGAKPVERATDDGVVNWDTLTLRVLGVGTPRILSPTGGLLMADPLVTAEADALARAGRLLGSVQVDGKHRLLDLSALNDARQAALDGHTHPGPRRFTDGTVHWPLDLSFAWIPAATETRAAPVTEGKPPKRRGLVIEVRGDALSMAPALRLRLVDGGGELLTEAGWPADTVGAEGVAWLTRRPSKHRLLGRRPLRVKALPGRRPGELMLDARAVKALGSPPRVTGGVVVVLRPTKKKKGKR